MNETLPTWLHVPSCVFVLIGLVSAVWLAFDIARRQPQPMTVMRDVWPINAFWAGIVGVWVYWKLGRMPPRPALSSNKLKENAAGMNMKTMDEPARPFWQSVVTGTLHCGAGCSLADLVGPFVFHALPFAVAGSMVFGEWTLDYILALASGVTFQYAALSPMLGRTGLPVWWRALKVDFFFAHCVASRHVRADGPGHLRLVRPHRAVAHRILVPDANRNGMRLLHRLPDELAADSTGN